MNAPAPLVALLCVAPLCAPLCAWAQEGPPPVERTHLVLRQVDRSERDGARYFALRLSPRGAKVLGEAAEVEGVAVNRYTYLTPAAHAGGETWISGEPVEEGGFQLVLRDVSGKRLASHFLGEVAPAALHALGGKVAVVGQGNRVCRVDFSASPPRYETVLERPKMRPGKAYDLFARAGEWLIAIDDVVMPIYGDTFKVGRDRKLTHEEALTLPGVINGSYRLLSLVTRGPRDGTLYAYAPYHIMSGRGHDLAALDFAQGKGTWDPDAVLQNSARDPVVLEEHEGQRGNRIAGEAVTPWTGLTYVPERKQLLAAAGKRGLLAIPAPFSAQTKAEALGFAPCLDVARVGGRLWVLLGGAEPALLELDPTTAKERGRTALPIASTEILD